MQRLYIRIPNGKGKSYKFIPIGDGCTHCLLSPDTEDFRKTLRIDKDLRTLYEYDWYRGIQKKDQDVDP